MRIKPQHLTLLTLLFLTAHLFAQETHTKKTVYFKLGSSNIENAYTGNEERINEIVAFINGVEQDSLATLLHVSFCGLASPEGSYQLNSRLAQRRSTALEKLIRARVALPDSIVSHADCNYIPWEDFRDEITASDIAHKTEILAILDEEPTLVSYAGNSQIDHRIVKLRQLNGGTVWRELSEKYYKWMRNAVVTIIVDRKQEPMVVVSEKLPPADEISPDANPEAERPDPVAVDEWTRRLHVKTNLAAWAMMVSNVAVEVDLAPHWSVTLPVNYSAMNYFKRTKKFRLFGAQPEVRYWLRAENDGWFVGGHYGFSYFNVAYGDWRYQDKDRHTPAQGGGVSAGWRKAIGKHKKWRMEFALGAGCYKVEYDKFINEPNGLQAGNGEKTFWGVDQAAVTFGYTFDLKKGGKR